MKIKISEIKVSDQPRKDFSSVGPLTESIRKMGLLVPLLVRRNGENSYLLIDGECRLRALRKLGSEDAEVSVIDESSEPMTETDHREMQIAANLCRADLSLIERARGFASLLLDAPAKYNTLTVARKFGYKENEVKKMVSIVNRVDPTFDADLSGGRFDWEDVEELSKVPVEFQPVVIEAAKKHTKNMRLAIFQTTEELHFDDVFGEAQARAAGKIHYKLVYGNPRTFDRDYALRVKEDFEARTKKRYAEERAKSKKMMARQKSTDAKQTRESREKRARESSAAKAEMRAALPKFMGKKADMETAWLIVDRYLNDIWTDDLKTLLHAFGVEFKASECSALELRDLVRKKILEKSIKSPVGAVNFVEFTQISHAQCSAKDAIGLRQWLRGMRSALKSGKK